MNPDQTPAPTPRRSNRRATIAIGVVLLGILALIYPVVSTHYNNYKQREFALKYGNNVQNIDTSEREAALEAAREYNKRLPGVPILDPWLTEVANPASPAYDEYRQQLSNAGDIIARLRVPSVSIDLPIRHDTQPEIIDNGVGHLYGTSLPVGGENTHSVLTTHTGLSTATLFDNLDKVKEGDLVYVDVLGHTLAYRVDQIKIVLPDEIGDLSSEPGRDLLTLFTCTPYAVNTHRLLVRAERIPMEESPSPRRRTTRQRSLCKRGCGGYSGEPESPPAYSPRWSSTKSATRPTTTPRRRSLVLNIAPRSG
ncbi:class C sortase [Trueperella pyogenes]|uniref:class C sortase n=1 Tax=Trueperella pyogenes TaxID=1661 RepID=UPI003132F674